VEVSLLANASDQSVTRCLTLAFREQALSHGCPVFGITSALVLDKQKQPGADLSERMMGIRQGSSGLEGWSSFRRREHAA
jgi:hypothetical protein